MTPKQAAKCCRPVDNLLDARLFKALSDTTRVKILACLVKCGKACSVTEIAECCSVDFSVVSRHLAILDRAGILESKKNGRTVYYSVLYGQLSQVLRGLADAIEACCPTSKGTTRKGECCAKT
jgi:ArsR family transcriptional regulator, arsenate/arsenite/antimonite-responsive transcriptional repressor